jgi:serine/threonine protein kinase/Tol biopolymer transport system component
LIGRSLAHYRVTAALGAGGMGEVYRASDSRLSRDVAIKVLPSEVVNDPDRLARFRREAQVLASLNHPNVGAIYGLEEADGKPFLVLELVEGETLAERIEKGALPLADALEIARQIAEGLGAAHEKGIVHRDLKPANVKLTPDGQVKVLDFGLARAYAPDGGDASLPSLSHSPTLAAQGTAAGMILGTAAYMSPEQARGKAVDKRADIWAFGVILWEMLTGQRLFGGETVSDILAGVLRAELDWKALPGGVPAPLERLLRRCLTRDPKARLHDIGDARLEIADALAAKPEQSVTPTAPGRRALLPWTLAGVFGIAATGLGLLLARDPEQRPKLVRFEVHPPPKADFQLVSNRPGPAVVSPDGRSLVFAAVSNGQTRLYVRGLDETEARPLGGTEDAQYPFWSPDSRAIGFFAEDKLKRVDATGGAPLSLCKAPLGKGGSWSPDGVIVFAPDSASVLQRVAQGGGEPVAVTSLDAARKDDSHRHPRFLPDGRHFLYLARNPGGSQRGDNAVMLGSLDGGPDRLLMRSAAAAEYAAGQLLFLRERTLMAQRFDARRLALEGEPVMLGDDVRLLGGAAAQAVVSASGDVLVLQQGQAGSDRKLVWRDRAGKALATLGDPARYLFQAALSPLGDAAAVTVLDSTSGNPDVWTYDLARGVRSRFTFDTRSDLSALFSPDGKDVVFFSQRETKPGLYRKPFGGAGDEELLLESPTEAHPSGFTPDGRTLLFHQTSQGTSWDLWTMSLEAGHKPARLIGLPGIECCGVVSPDGRLLAYMSDESGRPEVYVTPYPGLGRKWQVSGKGGSYPRWRKDGRELLYQALDGSVTAAAVAGDGGSFSVPSETALFKARMGLSAEYVFQPTADAQRFLVVETIGEDVTTPLVVTLGWQALLRR